MWQMFRSPALWIGVALLALGGGNWVNGHIKLAAYEALVAHDANPKAARPPDGFRHLNDRTNASVLRPLHSGLVGRSMAESKRDFYRVVLAGGRLITLAGLFLVLTALVHRRRWATARLLS